MSWAVKNWDSAPRQVLGGAGSAGAGGDVLRTSGASTPTRKALVLSLCPGAQSS